MKLAEIDTILLNEKKQRSFGANLGKACHLKNCVIFLQGELGAGKTTLARGVLQGLNYRGKVKSPTYTLVESYEFDDEVIYHVDLYRINSSDEVAGLGLFEKIHSKKSHIYLIEWPEKALRELPQPDITCYISPVENKRRCILHAHTQVGKDIILAMKKN